VARRFAHQQDHPPANPERDDDAKTAALSGTLLSPSWPGRSAKRVFAL
jgi:hypothetical protein